MKISPFSKTYEKRVVLDFPGIELQPGKIPAEARAEYEQFAVAMARYLISLFEARKAARAN